LSHRGRGDVPGGAGRSGEPRPGAAGAADGTAPAPVTGPGPPLPPGPGEEAGAGEGGGPGSAPAEPLQSCTVTPSAAAKTRSRLGASEPPTTAPESAAAPPMPCSSQPVNRVPAIEAPL